MDFTLNLTATKNWPSLRAALTAWRIAKTQQHDLRIHRSVLVNGDYRSFNLPIAAGDRLTLTITDATPPEYALDPTPIPVVYEDDRLLIVDKPAGIKPHPNQPGESGTAMNRIAAYLAPNPAYITHRLDMATSGLMVVAKDPLTQNALNRQLAEKTLARRYVALVPPGIPASGTIDAPIGRDPIDRRKRRVDPAGLRAVTHYRRLAEEPNASRVALTLETGRTHQLRVHLAHRGFPIIGDPLYSPVHAPRLMLHANAVSLVRPFGGAPLEVSCPVPF